MTDNVSRVKSLNIASFRNIVRERQRMWGARRRCYLKSPEQMEIVVGWLQQRILRQTGFAVPSCVVKMTPDQKGWVIFYD